MTTENSPSVFAKATADKPTSVHRPLLARRSFSEGGSTTHSPLVSICLPTLNARRFLEPRMDSILAQTLTDWELIVCDSFSDDGTWEYLQQFKDDARVRLYQVPREGMYAGWNECLRRCRGEYVYIATADDTMVPECLERMVAALEKAENSKFEM